MQTILPHLITYFEQSEQLDVKHFIHLVSDYLVKEKRLIEIESGLNIAENGRDASSLFDTLLKQKNLVQFMRLFEEKTLFKKSKLNVRLIEFINETSKRIDQLLANDDSILVELLFVVPFMLRHDSSACGLIENLNSLLVEKIASYFENNEQTDLEEKTFLLSLSVWSNLMVNKQENVGLLVKELCNLISSFNSFKLKVKIQTSNKYDRVIYDKCDNNLLRSLNYYLMVIGNDSASISIDSIIDILKSQLSSPYHEVRFFFCELFFQ